MNTTLYFVVGVSLSFLALSTKSIMLFISSLGVLAMLILSTIDNMKTSKTKEPSEQECCDRRTCEDVIPGKKNSKEFNDFLLKNCKSYCETEKCTSCDCVDTTKCNCSKITVAMCNSAEEKMKLCGYIKKIDKNFCNLQPDSTTHACGGVNNTSVTCANNKICSLVSNRMGSCSPEAMDECKDDGYPRCVDSNLHCASTAFDANNRNKFISNGARTNLWDDGMKLFGAKQNAVAGEAGQNTTFACDTSLALSWETNDDNTLQRLEETVKSKSWKNCNKNSKGIDLLNVGCCADVSKSGAQPVQRGGVFVDKTSRLTGCLSGNNNRCNRTMNANDPGESCVCDGKIFKKCANSKWCYSKNQYCTKTGIAIACNVNQTYCSGDPTNKDTSKAMCCPVGLDKCNIDSAGHPYCTKN